MRAVWRFGGLAVGGSAVLFLTAQPLNRLAGQDQFPARPPAPARLRPVRFPPFQDVALPNGMTLLLVENHEQPTLSVSLSFRAGNVYDPPGKEGVAGLVAGLLTKGTPPPPADPNGAGRGGGGGGGR